MRFSTLEKRIDEAIWASSETAVLPGTNECVSAAQTEALISPFHLDSGSLIESFKAQNSFRFFCLCIKLIGTRNLLRPRPAHLLLAKEKRGCQINGAWLEGSASSFVRSFSMKFHWNNTEPQCLLNVVLVILKAMISQVSVVLIARLHRGFVPSWRDTPNDLSFFLSEEIISEPSLLYWLGLTGFPQCCYLFPPFLFLMQICPQCSHVCDFPWPPISPRTLLATLCHHSPSDPAFLCNINVFSCLFFLSTERYLVWVVLLCCIQSNEPHALHRLW